RRLPHLPSFPPRRSSDLGQRLRLVEYSAAMPPHWCRRGHLGTILSGRFEIEFASGTEVFVEGDGVDIPSGESHRHRARALTETVDRKSTRLNSSHVKISY